MTPARASGTGALLVALGPISLALYTPAMPTLVTVFDTDIATIKLTLTLYLLGFAMAQLVCGPLSDAWGRKPVILGFIGLYLIGGLIAVAAPTVEWLLVARLVQGIGAAVGVAISRAIIRDLFTGKESVQVMNTIGLMLAAGPSLSPTIGGFLLVLFDWHAIFVLMVLYGVLVALVFLILVPETLSTPDPLSFRPRRLLQNYLTLLGDTRFMRPVLALALAMGTIYAMANILPFVLIDDVGLSPTAFGVGMIAQSGSFMTGSLVMRTLLKSMDAKRLAPVGLGIIMAGGALMALFAVVLAPSYLSVMAPVGIIAFGLPFIMAHMMTEALVPFPHMAGSASALSGFLQMAAGLSGSALAVLIGEPATALAIIVPVMILSGTAVFLMLRRESVTAPDNVDP